MIHSPPPLALGASQDRAGTMPPDVGALAGNGYEDRALALALRGTDNRECPVAWPAPSTPGSDP